MVTNTVNGKQYIGQTLGSLQTRWQTHCYNASGSRQRSMYPLYHAIRKYGAEAFSISLLAEAATQEELNRKEIEFIEAYQTTNPLFGYNQHPGGNRPPVSTPESRVKAAAKNRGQKRTTETRYKMSLAARGQQHFLGRAHSEETKAKISQKQKENCAERGGYRLGQKSSAEHVQKIAAALTGRKHSEESKQKMRLAKLNPSVEQRQKLRAAHLGKSWSEKRRAAYLARKQSTQSPSV